MPMRKIVPIDTTGLIPADLSKQKQFEIDLIDPRDCYSEGFQRDLVKKSEGLAAKIFQEFEYARFNVPVGCRVDGKICIINGQTTVTACASHPDIRVIPVLIVDVPEFEERARAFVSHSQDRVAATPGQIWFGKCKAGDPDAVALKHIGEAANVEILPYAPAGAAFELRQTVSIGAIMAGRKKYGDEACAIALAALADAGLVPITGEAFKCGVTLLNDPEYAADFDAERLTASFRALGPRATTEAKELAAAKGLPLWRALVAVIYRHRHRKGKVPTPAQKGLAINETPARPVPPARRVIDRTPPSGVIDRTPPSGVIPFGEPEPGRSALDRRRADA